MVTNGKFIKFLKPDPAKLKESKPGTDEVSTLDYNPQTHEQALEVLKKSHPAAYHKIVSLQ